MQHDDRAVRNLLQRGEHAVEVETARRRVEIRVGVDHEARALEQRTVVFPARIADVDLCAGREPAQEVGADLEAARAAERLQRDHAAGLYDLAVGAEHELLHGLVVDGDAVDRQIARGAHAGGHLVLGAADALQQRQLAAVVVVHADAEVDLARIGVGGVGLRNAEDRVARR